MKTNAQSIYNRIKVYYWYRCSLILFHSLITGIVCTCTINESEINLYVNQLLWTVTVVIIEPCQYCLTSLKQVNVHAWWVIYTDTHKYTI